MSLPPSSSSSSSKSHPAPQFPTHNSPRCWFLTDALTPLAIRLIRLLLIHGDYVAAGLPPHGLEDEERSAEFKELIAECKGKEGGGAWYGRIRGIKYDLTKMSDCQSAVAEAKQMTGRIDILLLCSSEAVVGTVEELSTNLSTQSLVISQFESNYFAPVSMIKAALPHLRAAQNGHIIVLTSIAGHIGTPGMPMYSASIWALEGFCDSLAYEIAPFNIKVSIVQPNKEIVALTNRIIFAPALEWYESQNNPAPMLRDILSHVVNLHTPPSSSDAGATSPSTSSGNTPVAGTQEAGPQLREEASSTPIIARYPQLTSAARTQLVMETVHALTAIGGHENPPARHIVGYEGVASVKEKLKTVSEELEDFVEVSLGVDIAKEDEEGPGPVGAAPGDQSMRHHGLFADMPGDQGIFVGPSMQASMNA